MSTAASSSDDAALTIARRLAGAPVEALTRVGGGRNSRVFRVDTADGTFALKQYPSRQDDPRDRQGVEANALQWMASHGLDMVPRLVGMDRDDNFSLLTWAQGSLVRDVGPSDVDQAADFLGRLHGLRRIASFPHDHLATEACLSGAEIERQIRGRLASLSALEGEEALQLFLRREFTPAFDRLLDAARHSGVPFETELVQEHRSLIPSDFGFHNALRDAGGRLTFIDFEYFGWDDPVKLTADVVLHPGTPVDPSLRRRFRDLAATLYGDDPGFPARLGAYFPLFGLRWALILLNEFHPERWRRRILAGVEYGWAEARERQLARARDMVSALTA